MRFFCILMLCFGILSTRCYASIYQPEGDIVGSVAYYKVKKKDNLSAIARRFDLGIIELLAANPGVSQKTLKAGAKLTLPLQHVLPPVHRGIVLNLSELRLFYFMDDGAVMTFPVGIGRDGWETPLGSTTVTLKRKDPVWIPPDSIREEDPDLPDIVPAGPDNPLGLYALNIGLPGIRIHGTNRPSSIGKRASHGCIRLYPEDIERLFYAVDVGVPVTILDLPYKLGWHHNTLWLEVAPTVTRNDMVDVYRKPLPETLPGLSEAIHAAASGAVIDWKAVGKAVAAHNNVPVSIGKR